MYDISAPQQGGADFDGDIFLLCNEPIIIDSKIDKRIILDIEDKATAQSKIYFIERSVFQMVIFSKQKVLEVNK